MSRANSLAKFIVGDIFVIPAVILSTIDTAMQSPWWLLLVIPGAALYVSALIDLVRTR